MTSVNVTEDKYSVSVTEGVTQVVTVKAVGPQGPQGALQTGDVGDFTVSVANDGTQSAIINTGAVTSSKILDGTIVNADINANAAISGSKINPSFGNQNIFTNGNLNIQGGLFTLGGSTPAIQFTDNEDNPDYRLVNSNGEFRIRDNTAGLNRIIVHTDGHVDITSNLDCLSGLDVTGDISCSGTVDGVDIAARDTLFSGLTSSSGVLTNGVTATTQGSSDNTTKVATTAYVTTAISNLINGAPGSLDTLNELAAAMNDDAAFSTTVTNSLATKMPLAGGEFTGNITFSGSQTVDGRDLSVDGFKLDGIESGATADQTASEILTLLKTVDGAGSGLDADTLDGISSASFVRSDANDGISGFLTITNDSGIKILTNTNGVGSKIQFSDHAGGSYEQNGTLTYKHGDGAVTTTGGNSNDGWLFEGSETRTVVKVVGDIEATSNIYGGNIFIPDNDNVNFGSGNDLTIVHDGTDSKITNKTGDLLIEAKNAETGIKVIPDGAVELYHDDIKKAETSANGFDLPDNSKLQLGDSQDLEIFHDTNGSFISHAATTGKLFIQTNSGSGIEINKGVSENIAKFIPDGAVELYFNGAKRCETTNNGATVSGDFLVARDGNATINIQDTGHGFPASTIGLSNGGRDLNITAPKDIRLFPQNNENGIVIEANGQVELYFNNLKKAETSLTGLDVTGAVKASTGILFGSDTADANTLDDYEEGTWTPTVLSEGNIGTPQITCTYTKIGRLVTINADIHQLSDTTSSTHIKIGGLPFVPSGTVSNEHSAACHGERYGGSSTIVAFIIYNSGSYGISFRFGVPSGHYSNVRHSDISDDGSDNNLRFTLTYEIT